MSQIIIYGKMDFFNKGLDVCAVSKDIDRKIINCNQKFLDFLGKTKEEVIGKTTAELRPDEHFAYLYKKNEEMVLAGKMFTSYSPVKVDGRITFFHGVAEIKADLDGTINGFKLSFYDTGKDSLLSLIPSIEFINGKYECSYANVGKSLFEGLFRTTESYVFYYLVRGWSIEAVAKKMNISVFRAQEIEDIVYAKMKAKNVDELFYKAARQDMLCNVPQDLLYKKPNPAVSENDQDKQAHYLDYAPEIKKIVHMAFESGQPLVAFTYGHIFADNSAVLLTTHPALAAKAVKDKTAADFQMLDEIFKAQQETSGEEKTFSYIKKQTGETAHSGIMLGHHHGDSIEIFSFGFEDVSEATLEREHLSLIKFCHTFMGHAKDIIAEAKKRKIFLDSACETAFISRNIMDLKLLSPRETEVMMLMVRGRKIKPIARILGLSDSSVSEYSRRIKEKLGVSTCDELSEKYWEKETG